ncbi:hypothetical protein PYW07_000479 [Mythimna separata]|uniref:Uncharacterized protein n=1 Tax=Mythimna separata TaxID=271217 RepID=A0AAD7Z1M6_MYTSE|nr:hypothetical protein PYW07_000479 [Mythimna separata]
MSDRYVVNELLAYIQTEIDNVPTARLIHVKMKCLEFFEADDILEARSKLYECLGMDVGILDGMDKQSNLLDIFDRFDITPKHKQPIFVSRDWRKLPQGKDHPATRTILEHIRGLMDLLTTPDRDDDASMPQAAPAVQYRGGRANNRRAPRRRGGPSPATPARRSPQPYPDWSPPENYPNRYGLSSPTPVYAAEYRLFEDPYNTNPLTLNEVLQNRPAARLQRGRGAARGWRRNGTRYVYR